MSATDCKTQMCNTMSYVNQSLEIISNCSWKMQKDHKKCATNADVKLYIAVCRS